MDSFDFGEQPAAADGPPIDSALVQRSALLRDLNPEQVAAATSEASRLCIIAGAGSGKTRVITRRIAYRSEIGVIDPRRVLALTFTRKAASELTRRLRQLGLRDDVSAGTFHGVAYAQLRARAAETGRREPQLLDRKVGFVAKLISRSDERTKPFDVVNEIEWAKARLVSPDNYAAAAKAAGRDANVDPNRVASLFADYETKKQKMGLVDFDDLLGVTASELRRDRRWGEAQRWRFRHLFVDEFQDVNPLQFALLRAWLSPEADLCVVGDPRQAIYGWNGADAGYITNFSDHFGEAQTLTLRRNHRSTPEILAAAEAVLDSSLGALEPLVPTRNPGQPPIFAAYDTDVDEAAGVARAVRDARRPGDNWSDQAILTRTNGQLARFEVALRAAGIPFRTRAGSDFLEQKEVKTIFESLATAPSLRSAVSDLELELSEGPHGAAPADETFDRLSTIAVLVDLAREFLVLDPDGPGSRFAGWLHTAVGSDRSGSITDAVELATFHASKGLEWPVVHIAGLEKGFAPIAFARTPDALLEERNLVHVAATRAERLLHISWAKQRTFGASAVEREPSPFLSELSSSKVLDLRTPLNEPQHQISEARTHLRSDASTETSERLPNHDAATAAAEGLLAWRKQRAEFAGVSETAILSDRDIEILAATSVRSVDDLEQAGLSPIRARRYGHEILRALGETPALAAAPPAE